MAATKASRGLLAIASMFVLMACAPRADAFVYWSNDPADNGSTIGRANLDGASANQSFITGAGAPHEL